MNAQQAAEGRRVKRRYSAEDRERLTKEFEASGKSQDEFCAMHGVKLATFKWWLSEQRKAKRSRSKLVEVEVAAPAAPIELELPGGLRIGVRVNGESTELAKLIRGVLAC